MKLKYEKPSMVIEKFEMCQNIAYGCEYIGSTTEDNKANWRKPDDCAWYSADYGEYVWIEGQNSCVREPWDDEVCYNGPAGNIVAFAS